MDNFLEPMGVKCKSVDKTPYQFFSHLSSQLKNSLCQIMPF